MEILHNKKVKSVQVNAKEINENVIIRREIKKLTKMV